MPNYTLEGKILTPISPFKFKDLMSRGEFTKEEHKALLAVLYYFGIRISEALSLTKSSFTIEQDTLYVKVERLKHSRKTQELSVLLDRPYVNYIVDLVNSIQYDDKLFPFSRVTGWRIVRKAIDRYPHFLRLNRITNLFKPTPERPQGYSIGEVRNFTGLTLNSLDYYVGLVKLKEIGEDLK